MWKTIPSGHRQKSRVVCLNFIYSSAVLEVKGEQSQSFYQLPSTQRYIDPLWSLHFLISTRHRIDLSDCITVCDIWSLKVTCRFCVSSAESPLIWRHNHESTHTFFQDNNWHILFTVVNGSWPALRSLFAALCLL